MTLKQRGILEVGIASLCFGLIGLFGKKAFEAGVSIGELLAIRFALAALLLGTFLGLWRRQDFSLNRKQFLISLALGIFGYAIFASLYFVAIEGLSIALAALLLYTYPFWTALFESLLGQKLRRNQWLGLFGAGAGLLFLLWGQVEVRSQTAVIAGVGSAITYSIFVIISGRKLREAPSLGSGFWIMLFAAMSLAAIHRPDLTPSFNWSVDVRMIILAIAIIGTVIPLVLIQSGLQKLSSTETAVLCLLEPVTAALAGALWLQESLSLRQALGALLVLASLCLTQYQGKPKAKRATN